MSLFEPISEDEFKKATEVKERKTTTGGTRKPKQLNTDDRTRTGWFRLPTFMDFCTVPEHAEVQAEINQDPSAEAYRQKYPTRMVIKIGELQVCRDCYVREVDKRGEHREG
jgi:hypothetical protein